MAINNRQRVTRVTSASALIEAKKNIMTKKGVFVIPGDLPHDYNFSIVTKVYEFSRKSGAKKETTSHYFLPIPATLVDQQQIQFEEVDLSALGGVIASTMSDLGSQMMNAGTARETGRVMTTGLAAMATQAYKKTQGDTSKADALSGFNAILPGSSTGPIRGTIGAFLGAVPNPNATAFFKGVQLKNYGFSWDIYPANASDAANLEQMINNLRREALPVRPQGTNVSVLTAKGGADEFGSYNIRVPSLTLKYPLEAHLSITTNGGQNTILFKPAFITAINVNYGPGGIAFLESGQPAGVNLTLEFKEMDIWTRDDYPTQGALRVSQMFQKHAGFNG
jgi:hypothetical protein